MKNVTRLPIMSIVVLALAALLYGYLGGYYGRDGSSVFGSRGGAMLTWTCHDGSIHIRSEQPSARCVGR